MDTVSFVDLRKIVQSYTNLIASINKSGKGGGVVAMDIGSIASVTGSLEALSFPMESAQRKATKASLQLCGPSTKQAGLWMKKGGRSRNS